MLLIEEDGYGGTRNIYLASDVVIVRGKTGRWSHRTKELLVLDASPQQAATQRRRWAEFVRQVPGKLGRPFVPKMLLAFAKDAANNNDVSQNHRPE